MSALLELYVCSASLLYVSSRTNIARPAILQFFTLCEVIAVVRPPVEEQPLGSMALVTGRCPERAASRRIFCEAHYRAACVATMLFFRRMSHHGHRAPSVHAAGCCSTRAAATPSGTFSTPRRTYGATCAPAAHCQGEIVVIGKAAEVGEQNDEPALTQITSPTDGCTCDR